MCKSISAPIFVDKFCYSAVGRVAEYCNQGVYACLSQSVLEHTLNCTSDLHQICVHLLPAAAARSPLLCRPISGLVDDAIFYSIVGNRRREKAI